MPAGDGSGPRGDGPLTGRAMGRCTGNAASGYATAPGRGGGRGMRRRYPQYDRSAFNQESTETESLKTQVQFVADTIEQIANRVNQLLKRKTEKE